MLKTLINGQDDHLAGAAELAGHQHLAEFTFHTGRLALVIGENFLNGAGRFHRRLSNRRKLTSLPVAYRGGREGVKG
ncbi:MAG: hypothetical protein AAF360_11790 [Pseudomonadota bacterium]